MAEISTPRAVTSCLLTV